MTTRIYNETMTTGKSRDFVPGRLLNQRCCDRRSSLPGIAGPGSSTGPSLGPILRSCAR